MFVEQRQSFRILASPGHDRAVLRIGWRRMKVRLIDESLGGYSISCRKSLKANVGDHLTLETSTGLYFVEVIRFERLSNGMILGLRRLAELKEKPAESVGPGWLALAAATGMLLVIALRPHLSSGPIRWQWPAWKAAITRSADTVSDLFERSMPGGDTPSR
jgi:hypothetical protein